MEIPTNLLYEIRGGNTILFLGAGASAGGMDTNGNHPPDGKQLAKLISERFLGGSHQDKPLSILAELAMSESTPLDFQQFIHDIFIGFNPAPFHKLLPTFKWTGIASTNFDLIIERSYQACEKKAQNVVPLIKNGDRVDSKIKSVDDILLVKLHGCITSAADTTVPLILGVDQYITHRSGRDRLFDTVRTWGYEHPIVFVGHRLSDFDIRQMLLELSSSDSRPRYFTVTPDLTDEEVRFWESKRVSTLKGTFSDFLTSLDSEIPSPFRGLLMPDLVPNLPISKRFAVASPSLSEQCQGFLVNDVEYVREGIPAQTLEPQLFYRGFSGGWSAIEQNLDVRREIADTILSDVVLAEDMANMQKCGLYILKGHAGSGKSVLLRRIAYEAAASFEKLCLFKQPHRQISFDALFEICKVVNEHVFLFIDKISENISDISYLIRRCRSSDLPVTIIATERQNEWNMSCESLYQFVTEEYDVGYLSSAEIDQLLKLLETHGSLGLLQQLSLEERRQAFVKRAGRQLLVALHEATLGKPFEDILVDEYEQIKPNQAQSMYLGICVLNQFDVAVRAGIISRVFNIRFTDFQNTFFKPLQKVVFAKYDALLRDYTYSARHSHIAEIVFNRVLSSPSRRLDMCLRLLRALNIDYSVDRTAYRRLTRGRTLLDLFKEHNQIQAIYELAEKIAGDDAYLYQQEAIYEMIRQDGNLNKATDFLSHAHRVAPANKTIIHSMAELELKKAEQCKTQIEFEKRIHEARKLVKGLIDSSDGQSHAYHTLAKIGLMKLRRLLCDTTNEFSESEFNNTIVEIEETLQEAQQRLSDVSYILEAESSLSEILTDEARAISALRKAFELNPHNSYVAIRLARYLEKSGLIGDSMDVYKKAIDAEPGNKDLHYNYGILLLEQGHPDQKEIEYHFKRAFTEGDRNYNAQFWYARQLYVNGNIPDSRERFLELRKCPIDPVVKRQIRGIVQENANPKMFAGRVQRLESSYCLITRDVTGDTVFLDIKNSHEAVWQKLKLNTRVKFSLGFTYSGAAAFNVQLE